MNNEPVAYLHKDGSLIRVDPRVEVIDPDLIPLYTHPVSQYKAITNTKIEPTVVSYTHPVKEQDTECQYCKQGCIRCDARKQLTDEEITDVFVECLLPDGEFDEHEFARAILRKAQE